MTIQNISVNNGKYTVVFDDSNGNLTALRYGEPWRDIQGDNLIYWLAISVQELRQALSESVSEIEWWQDEHICCSGKSEEFLAKAKDLLK